MSLSTIDHFRTQRSAKRGQLDAILAKATAESRDMSADEAASFDQLVKDVKAIDDRVAALEDVEAEEDRHNNPPSRGVRSKPAIDAPGVGRGRADQKPYSLMRAIRLAADHRQLDGLEGEVHQEVVRRSEGRTFKGFAMPTSSDPEIRALMYPHLGLRDFERRDLTTTTGVGGIFNVPESFVELLRARLVVEALGAVVMTDMKGNFSIPRQTSANVVQWVNEGVSASPTNLTLDQIPFAPKLAIATTIITKQFMMQTSLDAEDLVMKDLAKVLALEFDRVILNGSGGAQPQGLLQNPLIQSLSAGLAASGGNGGPLSYAGAVQMETQVATANADIGKMAYLVNPTIRGALKNTFVGTAGYPLFVFGKGSEPTVGEINGYPARTTSQMPSGITKGTSTNCSAVIFGCWEDLKVATWDTGVDVIVDPYTGKRSGAIEITTEMAMDSHPNHEPSFAIRTDVTPS